MSRDIVALVRNMPDVPAILAGVAAAGGDLLVLPPTAGAVVRLGDSPDGQTARPLLRVDEPILVSVPGEVARLLGTAVAEQVSTPVWWIEVRVAATPEHAFEAGYRFAVALVDRLDGAVWPTRPDGV